VVHQKTTGSLVDPQSQEQTPKTEVQHHQTDLTGGSDRSNQCATTQSGDFEVEYAHRDRKTCVEARNVCGRWASIRWCDDKVSQSAPWGRVS
jgi:hypothetical protein